MDPAKVEAIFNLERPRSASKIHSFLGLAGYYKRFVKNFLSIASTLTNLTCKEVKYEWDNACEESFQKLKKRPTSAPAWALPSGLGGYEIYNDASKQGLGCILMRDG